MTDQQMQQSLHAGDLADQITVAMMTMALQRLKDDDLTNVRYRGNVYWDLGVARQTAARLDMDAVRLELLRRSKVAS